MKLFLLSLALVCSVACGTEATRNGNQANSKPSPSPTAQTSPSVSNAPFSKEDEFFDDQTETRQQARQKALEYIQQNFSGWRVKGVISRRTFDEHYQVTLDLEKGKQTKTVQLLLRLFFPENGEPYWKVEPFVAQSVSPRKYQELAYLRFVKGQEYDSDSCREIVLEDLDEDDVPESVRDSIVQSHLETVSSYDDRDYEPADRY